MLSINYELAPMLTLLTESAYLVQDPCTIQSLENEVGLQQKYGWKEIYMLEIEERVQGVPIIYS